MGKLTLILAILLFIFAVHFDRKYFKFSSWAFLIPFLWFAIDLSRNVSRWMNIHHESSASYVAEAIEEGNTVDQIFFLIMMFIAFLILFNRRKKLFYILKENKVWIALYVYCLLSIVWSDFAYISFKRYIKDLNSFIMALVILTEKAPNETFKAIVRRNIYLLVPLSIVFCKYFPEIGRYQTSSWDYIYTGVTTHKNTMGLLCILGSLVLFTDIIYLWRNREEVFVKQQFYLYLFFFILCLYLLGFAHSITSDVCLVIGMAIIYSKKLKKHALKILLTFGVLLISGFLEYIFYSIGEMFVGYVNRDMTLSGRTELWTAVLKVHFNHLIGTGYSAFWLGDRLRELWQVFIFHPKQAHDGYLEVYINIGIIGLSFFLSAVFISYKKITSTITQKNFSDFQIAIFIIVLLYNITEAIILFNISPLWFVFLYAAFASTAEKYSIQTTN